MNDINNLLERLKTSLEGVESASKQTQSTVKSYEDLKAEVLKYFEKVKQVTELLNKINNALSDEKLTLKNEGEKIVTGLSSKFTAKVEDINRQFYASVNRFDSSTQGSCEKIERSVNQLKEVNEAFLGMKNQINADLEKVKKNTETISDIHKSISELNQHLKDIKQGNNDIKHDVITCLEKIQSSLDCANGNKNKLNEIDNKLVSFKDTLISKEDKILGNVNSLNDHCVTINKKIDETQQSLEEKIKDINISLNEIKGGIAQNHKNTMLFMFALLVVSIAGFISMFFR